MWDFPLFPDQASSIAGQVDTVYFALIGLSAAIILLVGSVALYFLVKYRRDSDADRSNPVANNWTLETLWIVIPFAISMGFFFWAAQKYFEIEEVPDNAEQVFVVGKQWMWKLQHPQGQREIDELHVPVNRPIQLRMTSADVIHSFYVPAFRVKQDVVPGRYTTLWFEAKKTGTYALKCAEYCGTNHSQMTGQVVVMSQADYQDWLSAQQTENPMVAQGERIFARAGCSGCHAPNSPERAPQLTGLFGHPVQLASGDTVIADATYLRDSILLPAKQVVTGYAPIMPSFDGQLSEQEIFALVEYIKSLSGAATGPKVGAVGGPASAQQAQAAGQQAPKNGSTQSSAAPAAGGSAARGEQLFASQGCIGCHGPDSSVNAPKLAGLFGSKVELESGKTVAADEAYIRQSILKPNTQVVAGYAPIMPAFEGRLSDSQVGALVDYIKSLNASEAAPNQTDDQADQ